MPDHPDLRRRRICGAPGPGPRAESDLDRYPRTTLNVPGSPSWARLALALAAAAVLGACTVIPAPSGAPSGSAGAGEPSGAPVLGIDWGRATSVERPENFEATLAPSFAGAHPILRIPGQATMADVMALPAGGYVSVGYSPPAWTPLAWTSTDGLTWRMHEIGPTEFTFPEALATGSDGSVVAVGRSGRRPMAWTTDDGVTWQPHDVSTIGTDGAPERMTTVAAGDGGYVAGGSVGPELAERHARFWTSPDGSTWEPVPDDAAAFAGAEVRAITRSGDGFVAVGVLGDAQVQTGAVAWTSPDGFTWERIESPAFDGGRAVAVVESPVGGLVAVGTTVERREAVAWTSSDGRAWIRTPTEASRLYGGSGTNSDGFVQMTDVAVVDRQLIGIGVLQGLQRGIATSWVSRDGVHWDRAISAPIQQQVELYAITAGGPGAIVVGAFGAPDSYVPIVLVSPAR